MEPTHQTLVLSQSFEPVKIVSWQRAITLLFLGKVEVVESIDQGSSNGRTRDFGSRYEGPTPSP